MGKNFKTALEHTLRFEGGYVDHPKDPGGATNFGITRKTLAKARGVSPWWKLPKSEVKNLQLAEVETIYFERYWRPSGAHLLGAALAFVVFDFAVHSGPQRAVEKLQQIIGAKPDGDFGNRTLDAVRRYIDVHGEELLVARYISFRHSFLKRLSTYTTFGRGWSNRLRSLRRSAKKILDTNLKTQGNEKMNPLAGYKTYLAALFMLLAGILELAGVDVPAIEGQNAAHLIMEAFAIVFLRKGLKTELANA